MNEKLIANLKLRRQLDTQEGNVQIDKYYYFLFRNW
jgi:hypothetical protein